jgi:hypothetical protein
MPTGPTATQPQGEANIMMRVPAVIGVCALILLGSALSACANSGGNSRDPAATSDAVCQPGICVGSTGSASLPWSVRRLH